MLEIPHPKPSWFLNLKWCALLTELMVIFGLFIVPILILELLSIESIFILSVIEGKCIYYVLTIHELFDIFFIFVKLIIWFYVKIVLPLLAAFSCVYGISKVILIFLFFVELFPNRKNLM